MPTSPDTPFGGHAPDALRARLIRWTRAMPDSWIGRRLAFTLRRRALKRLTEPIDTEAMGARFRLHPFDNICEKRILFTPQYFDPEERELIARRADEVGPGFVFLDIGANVGGYALAIAGRTGPHATILAVEPQPVIFERLCENIRQNPGSGVKAVACAIADVDGQVTLFLDLDNRGETSFRIVRAGHRHEGTITVAAKTLLTLIHDEGLSRVDAIKLDVGGAEDIILEPFLRHAPRSLWPSLLLLEDASQHWQLDVEALLRDAGYRRIARTRLNLVYELN